MNMASSLFPSAPILLVDDEPQILLSFSLILKKAGMTNAKSMGDSRQVMPFLKEHDVSVIVLDLSMPHLSGAALLADISSNFPHVPAVVVTATDDLETAVECMKSGAFDYLVKPVEVNRFVSSVKRAIEISTLKEEVSSLKGYLLSGRLEHDDAFSEIKTSSKSMKSIFQYAEAISNSQQPVLITGETGVGKELVAQAIHNLSGRRGSFVAVNIAGLDDTIFSDTLFGHKKGAFTGAEQARDGLIAQAEAGTLFLDEIGELNEASQIKLLRLLQEKKYYPLGSDAAKQTDARIIVATNLDIQEQIRKGKFRKDLYYRLRAHQIHIPPLRERMEDIPLLLNHFIELAATSLNKKKPSYPPELLTLLSVYPFPGNVRELQSMVFDSVARHRSGILAMDSFRAIINNDAALQETRQVRGPEFSDFLTRFFGRFPALKEMEDSLIAEALRLADNNQGIAASLLGITRQALNKRLTRQPKGIE